MKSKTNRVVVVRVVGGLGNQMFQYACGRAIAHRSNAKLLLDTSVFARYKQHKYGLDEFKIDADVAPWTLSTGGNVWSVLSKLGFRDELFWKARGYSYLKENDDLSFQPNILGVFEKVYLDGYWQNESYFHEIEDSLRSEFQLRITDPGASEVTQVSVDKVPSVTLHVRRGDYVTNESANSTHGVLGKKYYENAVATIEERIGPEFRLIVFSDDVNWARENLHFPQITQFVSGSVSKPHSDLCLMASCDHHIIANSTFSWWGAWLNNSKNKIVVAPGSWFKTTKYTALDICPKSWLRV